MDKIEWDESFSVGNADIDEQHKKWVAIYNQVYDNFDQKYRGKGDLEIMATLKSMLDYTRYHFDAEKEYMKSIDYPDIVEHLRRHKEFDNLIYKISRAVADEQIVLYSEVMALIKHWLLEHILKEDKKYWQFTQGQKI